ncbi:MULTISPECIES: PaaI family thioesterase [unclassified Gordonia (in: high G+C Gram-positive bacteria)]
MTLDTDAFIKYVSGKGLDGALGLELQEVGADSVVATLVLEPKHHQPFGIVHGGVYCAIGESVASMSAAAWLAHTGLGGTAVGVNNNTDFLKSVGTGTITARSTPIHRGRRQQLWLVEMTDQDGRALARTQVRLQNVEIPAGAPQA